jgi:hypothetical protein
VLVAERGETDVANVETPSNEIVRRPASGVGRSNVAALGQLGSFAADTRPC